MRHHAAEKSDGIFRKLLSQSSELKPTGVTGETIIFFTVQLTPAKAKLGYVNYLQM